jgi:hypothetical protein
MFIKLWVIFGIKIDIFQFEIWHEEMQHYKPTQEGHMSNAVLETT